MADALHPREPWVLLRRDKPVVRFGDLGAAKRFHDQLRWNGKRQPDAAVFGPGGEAWYCGGSREAHWTRDDARRKREDGAAPAEPETAR